MSQAPTEKGSQVETVREGPGERFVYLMPEGTFADDKEVDLLALWDILWRGKWLVIASTFLFAVGSVVLALSLTEWYRAEVLLAPADARTAPSIGGQLGGLAALAGVSVGGGESGEAIAILKSRNFARDFIEEFDLIPIFFSHEWDSERQQWLHPDPGEWPDHRDAVKYFHDLVLSVSEARDTGMVTLAVEWTDPELTAKWAMELAARVNKITRERALAEAEANVAYLRAELAQTNVVSLQESVGRLLESEMQKLMLARGSEEFAFRIIDAADVPKKRSRPRRTIIAIVGTMLGGLLGVSIVLLRHKVRERRADLASSA